MPPGSQTDARSELDIILREIILHASDESCDAMLSLLQEWGY